MATRHVILLANPEHIRHVFQDNYSNYSKQTPGFKVLRAFLADGLLTNEGDSWFRQRRIAQPAFHHARIATFAKTMTAAATELADRWDRDNLAETNVTAEMMRLTLRIVGQTLLSTDVTQEADRVGQALTVALHSADSSIDRLVNIPQWIPTPGNIRLRRALKALDSVVYEMIRHRREHRHQTPDLLSILMDASDEDTGESMNDRQLRDEVMTIFLAGHETTAVALSWTWHLLSKYPIEAQRMRNELATVLGGQPPDFDDLPRLTYTTKVIKESMRLYPPAWITSRCAIGPDRIAGYNIRPGTIIFASPYVTHRLPRLWENPEQFNPERFSAEQSKKLAPFAYFPFGGGPRQCIGNTFAMMEMTLVVATLAQRYRLNAVPGPQTEPAPGITLRSNRPITVRRELILPAQHPHQSRVE
tara:strand:+ start:5547 stop:6797 length:1251 start_codon:yes stop_codon:yes gene_type:complete